VQAHTCKTSNIPTRYTNYSPAVHSEPRKAEELQHHSFHSSTLARTWARVSLDAAVVNSKFRQAVNWCHTTHQLALNTGTLRPEAHVAASCVLELSQRKQKPLGSHKLAKQNHSSSEFLHCDTVALLATFPTNSERDETKHNHGLIY